MAIKPGKLLLAEKLSTELIDNGITYYFNIDVQPNELQVVIQCVTPKPLSDSNDQIITKLTDLLTNLPDDHCFFALLEGHHTKPITVTWQGQNRRQLFNEDPPSAACFSNRMG